MSFSEADRNKIRQQIAIRYPFTFYEEVSRALIIFKTFRGNKKIFRALPIMDELLDYVNVDPISGVHLYQMDDEARKELTHELIDLPQELVEDFKMIYHGTSDDYDGNVGLKHMAPGSSFDSRAPTVIIRKPMRFLDAYGDHPAPWIAFIAGFSYQISIPTPSGFPMTEMIPMVDMSKEDILYTFTNEIPTVVWALVFEQMWERIAPDCTRIERIISRKLTEKGFQEGSMSPNQFLASTGETHTDSEPDPLALT